MKNILFLFLIIFSISCKQSNISPSNDFFGKWKLSSYIKKDINNISLKTIIPSNKSVFVSFSQSYKFEEIYINTKPIEHGFLSGIGTYSFEGKNVRIVTYFMSCTCGLLFEIISVDKNNLILKNEDYGEFIFVK